MIQAARGQSSRHARAWRGMACLLLWLLAAAPALAANNLVSLRPAAVGRIG